MARIKGEDKHTKRKKNFLEARDLLAGLGRDGEIGQGKY